MNATQALAVIAIGCGATILIDLWALFLKRALAVPSLNYCLLGRWVLHMPSGKIMHDRIAATPNKRFECPVGWMTHYMIGISFAALFIGIASPAWLEHPTVLPALVFGIVTVLVPFFTMQPALGLGIASSRAPHPAKARLKSVMTHAVFGIGLWASASLLTATG
jgi:DUF2938 family protein